MMLENWIHHHPCYQQEGQSVACIDWILFIHVRSM